MKKESWIRMSEKGYLSEKGHRKLIRILLRGDEPSLKEKRDVLLAENCPPPEKRVTQSIPKVKVSHKTFERVKETILTQNSKQVKK